MVSPCQLCYIALLLAWESILDRAGNVGWVADILFLHCFIVADVSDLRSILQEEKYSVVSGGSDISCGGGTAAGFIFRGVLLAASFAQSV